MAYSYDQFLSQERPAPAHGMENDSATPPRFRITAQTTLQRPSKRIAPKKEMIFGENVFDNPVPEHTVCNAGADFPHVTFTNSAGQRFAMNSERLSKHLLLLGGIGSGKTNVFYFLLKSLLCQQAPDDIIFIFDTKGDFYRQFYRPENPHHILIGNSSDYWARTRNWNVFGELESANSSFSSQDAFTAKEIARQLFHGRESSTQPFFTQAASDLISKILIDFERCAERDNNRAILHNASLKNWLNRSKLRAYVELIERNEDFASARLYFGSGDTPQALGVFSSISSMHNDLLTGIFAENRPAGEFSMRSLVRERGTPGHERTVVFIEYDLSVGEVLNPMYRLLIDLALKEALSQSSSHRGNVIFVIDEFKLLPDLTHIDDALNFGRGLGVKVFAGLQSIDQMYANYGQERGQAILSGFMNSFCFQTTDYHSRKYISERFGENVYQLTYRTDEYETIQRDGHAIEDWEIAQLNVGCAAVDLIGEKPFLFQFSKFER